MFGSHGASWPSLAGATHNWTVLGRCQKVTSNSFSLTTLTHAYNSLFSKCRITTHMDVRWGDRSKNRLINRRFRVCLFFNLFCSFSGLTETNLSVNNAQRLHQAQPKRKTDLSELNTQPRDNLTCATAPILTDDYFRVLEIRSFFFQFLWLMLIISYYVPCLQ